MALQPFSWGSGGQKASPSSVKKYSDIAAALAAKGSAPQTFGAGLNRVGEALLSKSYEGRAEAGEAEGAASRKAIMDALMGNPDPTMQDLAGAMGNEWVTSDPGSSAVLQALMGAEIQQNDPLRQLQIQQAQQGLDKGTIELEQLRNPPAPAPEYDFIELDDGTIVRTDATSGGVEGMGQFGTPPAPDAPTLKTIFDPETGREQTVQWNGTDWEPIGGVQAPKDPLVQVNTGDGADAALDKALSTKEGEAWAGYKEAGTVSASNAQDFAVLDELINIAPQGPVTGRLAETFKGFSSAGDAFQSIVKRIAPTLRAPGSGATSDIEYDGMLRSLPALGNTPEANRMIASIMKAKAEVNIQRSEIVTQYQNGEISVGEARRKMNELDRVSILTPEMREALLGVGGDGDVSPAVPQEGEIVDGYIFKGGNPADANSWEKVM